MSWIRGYLRRYAFFHALLLAACIFLPWWIRRPDENAQFAALRQFKCAPPPGSEDLFVVMKTGSTVLRKRLPIYFETILKCIPDYSIFSDANESFRGHNINDALSYINKSMMNRFPNDFQFYDRIHKGGSALSTSQGWKLDKYKFLPMIKAAQEARPNARWFVFIEDDTSIVWSNLLRWLAAYDFHQLYFFGREEKVADRRFAHGGSGYVLSNAALRHAVDYLEPRMQEYLDLTNEVIYGDISLGWMLADSGIELTDAWPLFQGESPDRIQYTEDIWCQPVLTQHHMSSHAIASLWMLEQTNLIHATNSNLLHRDVFHALIRPRLSHLIENWDNGRGYEHACDTVSDCETLCVADDTCVQFRFASGQCRLSDHVKLGVSTVAKLGITSGWLLERVDRLYAGLQCN
ncbi:hypothetical protein PISL3812_00717 [Talaromyces islandicus]|uniref:N-acetylgalactosaminide beta-1,3-galactosyltransferase n=1 Tax=Talaromyces islandicus TaxID=28573 RepID=A0A0U1LLP1_TALIS|nr:hypothetical protein PISL3812_00717 [Talaromyces islandicus]